MNNENITFKIGKMEIFLLIGVLLIIFGGAVLADFFDYTIPLGLDGEFGIPIIVLGIWMLCGYATAKMLPNKKGSFALGFILGILGVIIALCIKPKKVKVSNSSKYEDLEKLQKLKDNGAITEEEFEKEKKLILKGE